MARRGLGLGSAVVISVLVIGIAAAAGIIPFRQVFAQERSVDLARRQRDALMEENLRLEAQIAALQTPGEVERLAREQFGLVKPGDVAYVAVPTVDSTTADLEFETDIAVEDEPGWWRKLWDFVTGRDLVEDE
jgi:cell division protein FtsB